MHQNRYWRTEQGFSLDTGAFVAAWRRPPGPPPPWSAAGEAFFATAIADLGLDRRAIAMVGDDIENDVLAAQAVGLTGVLVQTGKYRPTRSTPPTRRPHVASFAEVPLLRIGPTWGWALFLPEGPKIRVSGPADQGSKGPAHLVADGDDRGVGEVRRCQLAPSTTSVWPEMNRA